MCFPGARFDLLMVPDELNHAAAALAQRFSNVYVSGYGSGDSAPPTIEAGLSLRLQLTPMTKFAGFLSNADSVEWLYGKLQVVSKAMASAFAHLIESGYYEEEDVSPILEQILYRTPRDLYDLG
jgi:hypothetical protein